MPQKEGHHKDAQYRRHTRRVAPPPDRPQSTIILKLNNYFSKFRPLAGFARTWGNAAEGMMATPSP